MKRIFLLVAILCSLSVTAQRIYRIEGVPQRFVNALALPINPASYYNNTSDSAIIFFDRSDTNTVSFKYKGLVKKLGTSRMTWDSILNIPANFATTYALSNDVKDSILRRVRYIDTPGIVSGYTRVQRFLDSTLILRTLINTKQNILTNPVTGTGTTNTIPKLTGASTIGNSNITDNGTTITLGSNSRIDGVFGIGSTPTASQIVTISSPLSSSIGPAAIVANSQIGSNATSSANYMVALSSTEASSFTLPLLRYYSARQGTFGVGSSVTTQVGFFAESSLIGATNNYGFRGQIANGTGRWNLYMDGTANNYLAGRTLFGTTTDNGADILQANGSVSISNGLKVPAGNSVFGTSTARTDFSRGGLTPNFQIEGTSANSAFSLTRNSPDINPARLVIAKSRGSATGSATTVQNGDFLGLIEFQGTNGANMNLSSRIASIVTGTVSTDTVPSRLGFFTTLSQGTLTERMSILPSGRILAGVTLPSDDGQSAFQLNGTLSATKIINASPGSFDSSATDGTMQVYASTTNGIVVSGRGSTNDINLANKLAQQVLYVPTGTTEVNFTGGITAQRGRFTSLRVNKDSIPITSSRIWGAFFDTTGTPGNNAVQRRDLSQIHTGSAGFDTTTRTLTLTLLNGNSTSVVIPRGTASGASGITALSSSRAGNFITVSGDNGSNTVFNVRDADSLNTMKYTDSSAAFSGYERKNFSLLLKDSAAAFSGYERKGYSLLLRDTSFAFGNFRKSTTLIENSDLRNNTISGIALGSSLNNLLFGYGFTGSTSYNGSSVQNLRLDTSLVSTKDFVIGSLVGYATTSQNALKLNTADSLIIVGPYAKTQRLLDSLIAVQSRIQTKQPIGNYITLLDSSIINAGRWLPNRSADSIAVIRALVNTKLNASDTTLPFGKFRRNSTLIENSDLRNSTISGISLGSSLNNLIAGNGFVGSNYNGSSSITWRADTGRVSSQLINGGTLNKVKDSITSITVNLNGNQTIAGNKTFTGVFSATSAQNYFGTNGADNYIYLRGFNNSTARFLSSTGLSANYNGLLISSNAENGNTLPRWDIDLGGQDVPTNGGQDAFSIRRRPTSGGSFSTLFTVSSSGNVTANAFVKPGGTSSQFWKADGSVDNNTYLTSNQTITLSGDLSGSGSNTITATIGVGKVTNSMLAGAIDYSKMNSATVPTWNQNTTGTAANITATSNTTLVSLSSLTTAAGGTFGSYAFRSSGLAELSGADFTGGIESPVYIVKGTVPSIIYSVGNDMRIARSTDGANAIIYSPNSGNLQVNGNLTATNLIRNGGTSSQFLKADGSVDNNSYANLTGANFIGNVAIGATSPLFTVSTNTADAQQLRIGVSGTNSVINATRNSGTVPEIITQIDGVEKTRLTATRFTLSTDVSSIAAGTSDYVGSFLSSGSGVNTIFRAGKQGVTNGFTVSYTGSAMAYNMDAGNLSVSGKIEATERLKGSGFQQGITTKTSNYTLTSNDYTVIFNVTSANLTATLPAGVEGQIFTIIKTGTGISSYSLTINPNGTNTVAGSSSYIIPSCSGGAYTFQFTGGNWYLTSIVFDSPC